MRGECTMRTVAGAILASATAICFTVGFTFGKPKGGIEAALLATAVSGMLGLVLLAKGLRSEGRDSGSNS